MAGIPSRTQKRPYNRINRRLRSILIYGCSLMNAQARAKAPEGLQCQERMWAPSLTFHVQAQEANCHVAEPMRLQRKLNLLHFAS